MQHSKFIQALTLTSFASLITLFLLYRTGKLNDYIPQDSSNLQTSHNGGAITNTQKDTSKTTKVDKSSFLMSSSKTIILAKPLRFSPDTTKTRLTKNTKSYADSVSKAKNTSIKPVKKSPQQPKQKIDTIKKQKP